MRDTLKYTLHTYTLERAHKQTYTRTCMRTHAHTLYEPFERKNERETGELVSLRDTNRKREKVHKVKRRPELNKSSEEQL